MKLRCVIAVLLLAAAENGQETKTDETPTRASQTTQGSMCDVSGSVPTKNETSAPEEKPGCGCGGIYPYYPVEARKQRIQGVVVLKAVIGKDGTVKDLSVASGHPLLVPGAMEAVKRWKYKLIM